MQADLKRFKKKKKEQSECEGVSKKKTLFPCWLEHFANRTKGTNSLGHKDIKCRHIYDHSSVDLFFKLKSEG